mmetsp:Transcript_58073/g.133386  ORF Transcript_58073/g.133386 Transcript_58073/m.133386 type:complete len:258 (-) Transcript_58073:143-916(-)
MSASSSSESLNSASSDTAAPRPPPRPRPRGLSSPSESPDSTYWRIERPRRLFEASKLTTRTCTSWPTLSTSSTRSQRSSEMAEMWQRPSTPSLSVTNAPNEVIDDTLPLTNTFGSAFSNSLMSGRALRGARRGAASAFSLLQLSATCCFSVLTLLMRTETLSPTLNISVASFTKVSAISDTCSRPSVVAPMLTNAPYDCTLRTVPSIVEPSSSSSNAVRGSRGARRRCFCSMASGASDGSAAASSGETASAAAPSHM